MMARGEKLPVDLANRFIYYIGPVDAVRDEVVGPAGPTTSSRMDKFVEPVLAKTGLIGMVGKSERGPVAIEAIKKHGAVYCIAVGGAAYLVSKAIRGSRVLAFEDLGMEAIREFEVKDMPVTVAVDSTGNAVHKTGPARVAREDRQDPGRRRLARRDARCPGPRCRRAGPPMRFGSRARRAARRPLLVLAASAQDAERLREEIAWFDPKLRVHRLPDWEMLPYDQFSPHPDLVSERLATLWQFANGAFDVGIVPVTTALQRLPPRSYLAGRTFQLKAKRAPRPRGAARAARARGLRARAAGDEPGRVLRARRPDRPLSHRQRRALPHRPARRRDRDHPHLRRRQPALDLPGVRGAHAAGARVPARRGRARAASARASASASRAIRRGAASTRTSPTASRPRASRRTCRSSSRPPRRSSTTCRRRRASCCTATCPRRPRGSGRDLKSRYDLLRGDRDRPLLEPRELYVPVEDLFVALKAVRAPRRRERRRRRSALPVDRGRPPLGRAAASCLKRFVEPLRAGARSSWPRARAGARRCRSSSPSTTSIRCWWTTGQRFRDSAHPVAMTYGPLAAGFLLPAEKLAVDHRGRALSRARCARRAGATRARKSSAEGMVRDLAEVKPGDPVVHSQHGIARYLGLVTLDLGEGAMEFLHLEYEGGDKLYVPVSQLHVISRYTGAAPESAPLHRLGSGQWEKAQAQGRAPGARHRGRAARPLRQAPRAPGLRVPAHDAGLRVVRGRRSRSRRRPTRPRRSSRSIVDMTLRPPDGPAGLRRRGLRQDRGRDARGVRRGGRRQAGRDPRAHDAARRAALRQLQRPLLAASR